MKEKKSRTPIYLGVSLFILFMVIGLLIPLFMNRNRERIIEQNQQYLEGAASQSVHSIEEVFENASQSIAMISRLYELQLNAPEFDYHLLNEMSEPTSFDYIRFVGTDGISWSGDGISVDCRDREYYLEGIQGNSGVCYVDASRFTQSSILLFYTPLYYGGEIIGVVNGVMDTEHLSEELHSSFFGTDSDACICLPDGTVVAAFWEEGGKLQEMMGSMFSGGIVTEKTRTRVMAAFREGETISFRYHGAAGIGNAYLAPVSGGKFMLIQTMPSAVSHGITERANRDALKLELALIAVFLCYVFLLALYYIRRNRMLAQEKEDLSQIVNSVKRLYRRFVVLDLDENSYEYLEEGDISTMNVAPSGKFSDWWEEFRKRNEERPEYWSNMEDMEAEHLRHVLTRENWYSQREYRVPGERWERLSLIKLDMEEERTNRILGAVEDITEGKRKDEESRQALETAFRAAEAASRAKSDFLSRMSHDIRTPMNAIVGLTAIMGTHLDDRNRIVDCLTKITASSKHLLGLINEVLDMSKIESGKLVLSEAEFSLSTLVDDVLGIIQPMVNAKHQELTVHIQGMNHEEVLGDALRLQQVFVNILSNAVKYTEEGGHIKLEITEQPGRTPQLGEYLFIVEDDGIGMSPEFLEKLYVPFERAQDDRISKIQGTGLGMAIAQNIVRLMGGTLNAESELGKGTRFTVLVSLKLQEENEEALEQLVGLPVLVADDDSIACETTCVLLGELGMQGEWVLGGREAVERVRLRHEKAEDYFAVILDWQMPGMDGVETTRAIRKEVGPDVPIIILSAYDWSEIEAEARAAGVNAFIGKPLFKSRLRGVFANIQSGKTAENADVLQAVQEQDYTGKRVLLVEDNELNQEIAKEILEMTGLTVDIAENGKVAVERFQASAEGFYDMIFMDIQMPVMNGYEATRAIRALPREDAGQIPIVAMTANTFSEDVQMVKEAGMDQHIGKPLDMDQLAVSLKKWLG